MRSRLEVYEDAVSLKELSTRQSISGVGRKVEGWQKQKEGGYVIVSWYSVGAPA